PVAGGHGVDEVGVITATGLVSIKVEFGLKTNVPIGQLEGIRNLQPAFDRLVSEAVLAGGQFEKRHQRQRKRAAIVADQIELNPRCHVKKPGLTLDCAGGVVCSAFPAVRGESQLKIEIVEHPNLHVHGSSFVSSESGVSALRVMSLISEIRKIHLKLEVACI